MAESLNSSRRIIISDAKIFVNVDHASEELLVVSYPFKNKLYQGILIDSTNRYLPCGYPSPEVVKWSPPRVTDPPPTGVDPSQDTNRPFYSLSNRFTYFQDVLFQKNIALVKSAKQAKAKAQKMTVRLRPRQVLCSKCRSICNENSENVHSTSNNKKDTKVDGNSSSVKNLLTESASNENQNQNVEIKSPRKKVRTTLEPKLSRLEPEDVKTLNGSQAEASKVWSEMLEADKQMVLRKKRSVGSMEDLWDETVFEEAAKKAKTTPIIKISFGSPGEGTVLKIPSKVQLSASEGEEDDEKGTTESSKYLKKAMKKAKKEAKRKISPERDEEPSPEEPNYKKHRHRVKHKKRHKNSKEEEMKDKCLKQKLSISLRRVCGPGEEESWSGESSRSSEPVKDPDDVKSDLMLQDTVQISSRLPCEDTQDCKNIKRVITDAEELPKKTKKACAVKRKKIENVEDSFDECSNNLKSQGLDGAILKNILIQEKSSLDSGQGIAKTSQIQKNSDSSVKIVLTSHSSEDSGNFPCSSSRIKNVENIKLEKPAKEYNMYKSEYLSTSKNVAGHSEMLKEISESRLPGVKQDEYNSETEDTSKHLTNISEGKHCDKSSRDTSANDNVGSLSDVDDTLDEVLNDSGDSMPELEDLIDALLDSDKEIDRSLNQRRISGCVSSLDRDDEPEREIPVLQRMVDLNDERDFRSRSSNVNESKKLQSSRASCKNQLQFYNNRSKPLNINKDCGQFENADKISDPHNLPKLESSELDQSENLRLTSDDFLDSSGESEFLPAEDSFDCPPMEDSLNCPPVKDNLVCSPSQVKSEQVPSINISDSLKSNRSGTVKEHKVTKLVEKENISKEQFLSSSKNLQDCLLPKESEHCNLQIKTDTDETSRDSILEESNLGDSLSKDSCDTVLSHFRTESASKAQTLSSSSVTKNVKLGCEPLDANLKKPLVGPFLNVTSQQLHHLDHTPHAVIDPSSLLQRLSSSDEAFKETNILDKRNDSVPDIPSSLPVKFSPKLFSKGCLLSQQDSISEHSKEVPVQHASFSRVREKLKKPVDSISTLSEICSDDSPSQVSPKRFFQSSPESRFTDETNLIRTDYCQDASSSKILFMRTQTPDLVPFDTVLSDDTSDAVPNFPNSSPRGAPQDVTSCQTVDGSVLTVGDIVWAKIHGFPWWPAKVVRLCASGNGSSGCDARVAWFGSATSSLMSTDQLSPFVQTFKARYNRERKSTGYLEAIRQATNEARDFNLPQPLAEIDKLLAL